MADRIILPRATDSNGDIVAGAKAYFYEVGTTTPLTVYSDSAGTIAVSQPLLADSTGTFAATFTTQPVKVVITDTDDVNLPGYPSDPHPISQATGTGAAAITFNPITGNSATDVQGAIQNLTTLWNAVTTFGKSLIAAATASDARTVLGLDFPDNDDLTVNGDQVARRSNVHAAMQSVGVDAQTLAGVTEYDTPDMDGYRGIRIRGYNIVPGTDGAVLRLRTSPDASAFDEGASDYNNRFVVLRDGTTADTPSDASSAFIPLSGSVGNTAGETANFTIEIIGIDTASPTAAKIWCEYLNDSGSGRTYDGSGRRKASAVVRKARVYVSTGTFSGEIVVEGIR